MENSGKNFVERTKKLIEDIKTENDVSLLINCAFGLTIFPHSIVLQKLECEHNKEGWWSSDDFWNRNLRGFTLPKCLDQFIGKADKKTLNRFPKTIEEF